MLKMCCCREGSGKSYTMMGASQDEKLKGIIPRLCDSMFARISEVTVSDATVITDRDFVVAAEQRLSADIQS